MRKSFTLIFLIVAIILAAIFVVRIFSGEDNWICQNGQWVKHGNPSAPKPTSGCGGVEGETILDIRVDSPQSGETIESPVLVKGEARGNWFFEAVFPVKILDENGKELGFGQATATSDWMTENLVPFQAEISFERGTAKSGVVLLQNDNPSGLPENSKSFSIPVNFSQEEETTKVKVYFNNNNLDPAISCNKVFAAEREIPKTQAMARAALEELLKGPSDKEKSEGYFTSINSEVKIQKLTIENGIAKADFDEQLEYLVGGSCRVSAIRAQIEQTLKQFPAVKDAVISINGRTEDILQP